MAHSHTTHYDYIKPEVASDTDAWGGFWNTNADDIDADLYDIQVALDAEEVVGAAALPKAGGTMTGRVDLHSTRTAIVAAGNLTGTHTFALSAGDAYTGTVTGAVALTFTPVSGAGMVSSFVLHLTNGGAYAVTWPVTVKWSGGLEPALTASGTDVLAFLSFDAGTTWIGAALLNAAVPA